MNSEFHQYSKYIDHSELFRQYYLSRSVHFNHDLFAQIDSLVSAEVADSSNRPLLLEGGPSEGKKTLLTQWTKHHQSLHKEDIIIIQYATSGFKYSQMIYRTLAQLRETLDISQKVEIHEEKLRKYFPYWMEICSKTLRKQALEQGKNPSRKIVLVFPSIDLLTNSKDEPLLPGFWLPETFPFNVRVILSATRDSQAAQFLRKLKPQTLKLPPYNNLLQHLINQAAAFTKQWLQYNQSHLDLLYIQCFNSLFQLDQKQNVIIKQFDLANLKELSLSELLFETIAFWAKKDIRRSLVESLLIVLSLSKKGLTAGEICHLTKMKPSEFKKVMGAFGGLLECYQDMWYIPDHRLKEAISDLTGIEKQDICQLHMQMALGLREFPSSLRKLEQETYHLVESNCLPQLKQTISQVQNFLLLFNWHTKYELCHYWQLLQMRHAFDPVFQYNRSVTAYEMHSYPTEQNLFRLILQLSRFFIEYAHFEMYDTPNFRHPQIKGDQDLLAELHVGQQFKAMGMLMERELRYTEQPKKKKKDIDPGNLRASISNKSFEEMTKHNTLLIENKIQRVMRDIDMKKPVKLHQRKQEKTDRYVYKNEQREWVETISIQIPGNRQKFMEHYLKQLEEYFAENHLNWEQDSDDDQEDMSIELSKTMNLSPAFDLVAPYSQYEQEKYHLNFTEPKNYYYKQWLWVQFPWISLSLDHDYSRLIKKCIKSSTEYISVKEERELTQKAFMIAMETRRRSKLHHKIAQKIIRKKPRDTPSVIESSENRSYLVSKSNTSRHKYPRINKDFDTSRRNNNSIGRQLKDGTFITGLGPDSQLRQPLPTIKTSRTNGSNKRNQQLELKRQFNMYVYENAKLQKKIAELKLQEEACQNKCQDREEQELFEQVKTKQNKADDFKYELAKSLIQQEKLKIILDICKENVIYNTECVAPLNNFVSNLKAMIEQTRNQNKKFKEKSKVAQRDVKQRIKVLIDEIMSDHEEKKRPIGTVSRLPTERDIGRSTKSNFPKKLAENSKDSQHKLSNHEDVSTLLKVEDFENKNGPLSLNNPRIVSYLQVVQRKRHLKSRIIQLELQRQTLQKQINNPQKHSKRQSGKQHKKRKATIDLSKQHELIQQLQILKQKKAGLLMFLDTVQTRLKESNNNNNQKISIRA